MSAPTRVVVTLTLELAGLWEFPDDVPDIAVQEVIEDDVLGFYQDARKEWRVERGKQSKDEDVSTG